MIGRVLALTGAAAALVGIGLLSVPVALITGGFAMVGYGVFIWDDGTTL